MKQFTEAEQLCMRRLKAKGTPLWDIANRIGITIYELKTVLNWMKNGCK